MTKTQKKELAWALQTKIYRNVEQQLYCEGEALRLGIELVLECIEAGFSEPLEIAELTGFDVSEVNNIQKRLRRASHRILCDETKGACHD